MCLSHATATGNDSDLNKSEFFFFFSRFGVGGSEPIPVKDLSVDPVHSHFPNPCHGYSLHHETLSEFQQSL